MPDHSLINGAVTAAEIVQRRMKLDGQVVCRKQPKAVIKAFNSFVSTGHAAGRACDWFGAGLHYVCGYILSGNQAVVL